MASKSRLASRARRSANSQPPSRSLWFLGSCDGRQGRKRVTVLPKAPPAELLADLIGNCENAQRGSITITKSGEDAKVTYRGKNRYNFGGYLDHFGGSEVELAHGGLRGLPLELRFDENDAVHAITLAGADFRRQD